jgi:hypothetical protein
MKSVTPHGITGLERVNIVDINMHVCSISVFKEFPWKGNNDLVLRDCDSCRCQQYVYRNFIELA